MQIYTAPSFSNDIGRTLIFGMMQDLPFDMINDERRFRNDVHFGIALSFRNEGYDLLFGRGTDLSQISLQIYRQSHFGMIAEQSFSNDGYDRHFGIAFRFILDFLLDLWLIFSE